MLALEHVHMPPQVVPQHAFRGVHPAALQARMFSDAALHVLLPAIHHHRLAQQVFAQLVRRHEHVTAVSAGQAALPRVRGQVDDQMRDAAAAMGAVVPLTREYLLGRMLSVTILLLQEKRIIFLFPFLSTASRLGSIEDSSPADDLQRGHKKYPRCWLGSRRGASRRRRARE